VRDEQWARADGGRWPGGATDSGYDDMMANWWKFGFVVPAFGGTFIEAERAPHVP
jgi:hypothetical protein